MKKFQKYLHIGFRGFKLSILQAYNLWINTKKIRIFRIKLIKKFWYLSVSSTETLIQSLFFDNYKIFGNCWLPYYFFYINRIIKRIIKPYWKLTLIYCILNRFWFCTFDFLCRKLLLKCLQKFQKTHGFRTQFFLKKLNSLTMKSNRNVYIDMMINYKVAITKWKQFYEVGAIFTVVQLFLVRS